MFIIIIFRWTGTEIPVVRFRNGAEIQVLPTTFSSTVPHTGECRRVQIPLKLAWVREGRHDLVQYYVLYILFQELLAPHISFVII
jgi:hypothetical protein